MLARRRVQERQGALQCYHGISVLRVQLRHIGLCRIDVRLKGRLLDPIQQIALLYLGPFGEEPLFKEASDARHEATRFTAWTRPINSSVWVICCRSARTTPTAGGAPVAGCAAA